MPVFLFSDIEGSTQRWEADPDAMGAAVARHNAITTQAIESAGGRVIKNLGDGLFAVFESGGDPLGAAISITTGLQAETWPDSIAPIRVRIGLHSGDADARGDDYFGPTINRSARIMSCGWGGQILFSEAVRDTCTLPTDASITDLGVHTLKDLTEPLPIYMLTHPDLIAEFPPIRSLSAQPNNLPQQTTPFIGRTAELESIGAMLQTDCRIVTVLGAGGMGKTRIGLQTAAEHIDRYRHGGYPVLRAPLDDSGGILSTLAQSLKFSFYDGGDPHEQMMTYLREKDMLLVMDNFEHVLDGADFVTEILNTAPGIKVVATSRARLNLRAECVHEIGTMTYPVSPSASDFDDYESIQLFLSVARRADPDYTLESDADRAAVLNIVELVGAMPLGIELAASWVRSLPVDEIAEELEDDIDFLESTMRDVPERHRSMRAVFDYSWRWISDDERDALIRLSVFRGGFDRKAAKDIAGVKTRTLAALVDKSLLRKLPNGRYDQHTLLRQFAEERLADAADIANETYMAHCDYYAGYIANQIDDLNGAKQKEAIATIDADIENIRVAWERSLSAGVLKDIANAHESMARYFELTSQFNRGIELFQKAIDIAQTSDDHLLPELLTHRGLLVYHRGDYEAAKGSLQDALTRAESTGDDILIAGALRALSMTLYPLGEFDESLTKVDQALAIYESAGDVHNQAQCWLVKCYIGSRTGSYVPWEEAARTSYNLFKQVGDKSGMAEALTMLGAVQQTLGHFEEAHKTLTEATELTEAMENSAALAFALYGMGYIEFALGHYDKALSISQRGYDIYQELGIGWGIAWSLFNLGLTEHTLGHDDVARAQLEESVAIHRLTGNQWALSWILGTLGDTYRTLGELDKARTTIIEGLQVGYDIGGLPVLAMNIASYGFLLVDEGRTRDAAELLYAAFGHPAIDRVTDNRIIGLLEQIKDDLSDDELAAARAYGEATDLEDAAERLLGESS